MARLARLHLLVLLSIAISAATGSGSDAPKTDALAFVDVNVVPMDVERVLAHENVIVRGDRIAAMGPTASTPVPAGARRIDGRGLWLMPGLIDMHVHLNDPDDGPLYVANGVTTVRNMWGFPDVLQWRSEYLSGARLGPRVYTTGPILDGNPPIWPGSHVIETAAQADSEIAAEKAAGYDFVKVYSRLSASAYQAIVAAARRAGLRVVGHVPDSVGVAGVLAAGQSSIEHLTGYLTAAQREGSPAPAIAEWNAKRKAMLANLDESRIPELARKTREAGTWNCVTLIVGERFSALDRLDSLKQLPEVRYVPPMMLAFWDPAHDFRFNGTTAEDFAAMRAVSAFQKRVTRALHDAGAKLLLGTDVSNPFVVPGFSAHQELALLVASGLTPYEALRAGTSDAADFLHADTGVIRTGRRADLVLVEGNPLRDVRAASRRRGVVLRGRWFPAAALDSILADVAMRRSPSAAH